VTEFQWGAAVLGAGIGSWLLRAAPFLSPRLRELGRRHLRCLTYVSLAVAAGIVSRAVFIADGHMSFETGTWIKLLAVVAAVAIHRVSRNTPVALFSAVALAAAVYWSLAASTTP